MIDFYLDKWIEMEDLKNAGQMNDKMYYVLREYYIKKLEELVNDKAKNNRR
jgi:hypothetical protein